MARHQAHHHQYQQPLASTATSQLQASCSSCVNVEQSLTWHRGNGIDPLNALWSMTSSLSSPLFPVAINHELLQLQNCNGSVGACRTSADRDVLQRPTVCSSPMSDPRLFHNDHIRRLDQIVTPPPGSTGSWTSWSSVTPSPLLLLSSWSAAPLPTGQVATWSYCNWYLWSYSTHCYSHMELYSY